MHLACIRAWQHAQDFRCTFSKWHYWMYQKSQQLVNDSPNTLRLTNDSFSSVELHGQQLLPTDGIWDKKKSTLSYASVFLCVWWDCHMYWKALTPPRFAWLRWFESMVPHVDRIRKRWLTILPFFRRSNLWFMDVLSQSKRRTTLSISSDVLAVWSKQILEWTRII